MPWHRFVAGVAACLLVWAPPASAILVKVKMTGDEVGGYLVRKDDKKMVIRTTTPDGREVDNEYALAKIEVLHELDGKRLESLSRDTPRAYREYADELTQPRLQADPEAKYTARRLYLIAASLDPEKLGTSSLLRLSDLAGTQAEARKCRALAYLLDRKVDAKLLTRAEGWSDKPLRAQPEALQDFMKSLQYYRAGKLKLAVETSSRKGVDTVFSMAPGGLDQLSFRRMCTDANCSACKSTGKVTCVTCLGKGVVPGMFGKDQRCPTCNGKKVMTCETCGGRGFNLDLSDDTLRVLLRAELWATEQLLGGEAAGDKKKAADSSNWSSVLHKRQRSPVLPLSLETITEFDPRKCQYRNGNWVVPSDR